MKRDRLLEAIRRLGIPEGGIEALKVLPIVYVAWANGHMSELQRRSVLEVARRRFRIGRDGEWIVRQWLRKRPLPEYFAAGFRSLLWLAHAPEACDFEVEELRTVLIHAEAIARVKPEAKGMASAVTPAEEWALAHAAQLLRVETGKTWTALLRELDHTSARPGDQAFAQSSFPEQSPDSQRVA